jgi:hypothetical protein
MFPVEEIKIIIDYLRGTGGHTLRCVALAALSVLRWAVELVPDPHVIGATIPTTDQEIVEGLEALCNPAGGVVTAEAIPPWLIPILFVILRRLLGV